MPGDSRKPGDPIAPPDDASFGVPLTTKLATREHRPGDEQLDVIHPEELTPVDDRGREIFDDLSDSEVSQRVYHVRRLSGITLETLPPDLPESISPSEVVEAAHRIFEKRLQRVLQPFQSIGVQYTIDSETGIFVLDGTEEDDKHARRFIQKYAKDNRTQVIEDAVEELVLADKVYKDELTGLPNRRGLSVSFENDVQRLKEVAKERSERDESNPHGIGMLFVDIDLFKNVNDKYGHDEGDAVIQKVGELLQHTLRPGDTVSRRGGEEFVVTVPDITKNTLPIIAERVQQALRFTYTTTEGEAVPLTASIGTTFLDEHHLDAESDPENALERLIRQANAAEERAKVLGRDRTVDFETIGQERTTSFSDFKAGIARTYEREIMELSNDIAFSVKTGDEIGAEIFQHRKQKIPTEIRDRALAEYVVYLARELRSQRRILQRMEKIKDANADEHADDAPLQSKEETKAKITELEGLVRQYREMLT